MNKQNVSGDGNVLTINQTNIYHAASEIGELLRNGNYEEAEQKLDNLEEVNTKSLNYYLTWRFVIMLGVVVIITLAIILIKLFNEPIEFISIMVAYIALLLFLAIFAKKNRKSILKLRLKQTAITDIRKEVIKHAMYQELKKDVQVKDNDVK